MKAEDAKAEKVPAPGSSHAIRGSSDDAREEDITKEEVAGIANEEETELAPDSAGKTAKEEEELASGSEGQTANEEDEKLAPGSEDENAATAASAVD